MPKELTIVCDGCSDEVLYIDDKLWDSAEYTVDACDIAEASEGEPVVIKHVALDSCVEDWPESLADLLDAQ